MSIRLTVKGEELLQKLQAGEIERLHFTDMAVGCGLWAKDELGGDISSLKDIKLKQAVATKYAEKKDDKTLVFVSTTFSNKNIPETFYVYEVGLYALDGENEVLYAYDIVEIGAPAQAVVQDQSIPQYIPVSLDIGLSNIDGVNLTLTADLSVISAEQFRGHTEDYNNPHKLTKAQVGLPFAENTKDMDKPISTATQIALDNKQPTGDYATNTALKNGLAGKSNTNHTHNRVANADNAVNADTVDGWHRDDIRNWNNILNKPNIPPSNAIYITTINTSVIVFSNGYKMMWGKLKSMPAITVGYFPLSFNSQNYCIIGGSGWFIGADFPENPFVCQPKDLSSFYYGMKRGGGTTDMYYVAFGY